MRSIERIKELARVILQEISRDMRWDGKERDNFRPEDALVTRGPKNTWPVGALTEK
jgi:hypothetical protein